MKILIADDHFTSRRLLAAVLKTKGHEVVETGNGAEAWQAMQDPDPPRLLILDWLMPEMDGVEVLRRVRGIVTDRPAYIIFLTAKDEKDHIIAGLSAGANDYLTKPFDAGELLVRVEVGERTVEMQLRQHRQRANAQRLRVATAQRIAELESALAGRSMDLRRAQEKMESLTERLQDIRQTERRQLAREWHTTMDRDLTALREDLEGIDRQLRATAVPEVLSQSVSTMGGRIEHLMERAFALRSTVVAGA